MGHGGAANKVTSHCQFGQWGGGRVEGRGAVGHLATGSNIVMALQPRSGLGLD